MKSSPRKVPAEIRRLALVRVNAGARVAQNDPQRPRGLLASPLFWIGGALSLVVWTVVAAVLTGAAE